jgi:hypothetical protein
MSNFECSVKDLMSNKDPVNTDVPDVNLEFNKTDDNVPHPIEKHQDVNLSVYQKLYTDKNIKTVLFITLIYLALNSQQMYTFLSNNAPMLIPEGSPGFLGKAAIGLILGIIIVVFTSFFSF